MTTATQIERLKQATRVIRALPPERELNMMIFGRCGTVACVAGWCTMDKWFIAHGFHHTGYSMVPIYQGQEQFPAIEAFFGKAAKPLFSAIQSSEREVVIGKFEAFIATAEREIDCHRTATTLPIFLVFPRQDNQHAAP